VAERTTLAAVIAVLGVFIILVGLGYIQLPGPDGGGGGGGTTTTTTTTTSPLAQATLRITAKDVQGNVLTQAPIYVDGQLRGSGTVTVQVQPYTQHTVRFGDVPGYYTPPEQRFEPWPGQVIEIVGVYYSRQVPATHLLTVYVRECNRENVCNPYPNVDVRLDDGQRGRTGTDGKVVFRVTPGRHVVTVTLANGWTQQQTVDVWQDTQTTVTIRTSGLSIIGISDTSLLALAVFLAVVLAALFWRRRR
jgi:hypothetical protein